MKRLLFALVLCADVAFAGAGNLAITVKNFNFNYTSPSGEGSATAFSRNQLIDQGVFVRVEKVDQNFLLNVSGAETQEFVLENAPSFMTEAETMSVTGFNLGLGPQLTMNLSQGRFNSRNDSLKLDGLILNCNRDAAKTEVMDQLIAGCVQKLALKTSKFSSQASEEVLVKALSDVAPLAAVGVKSIEMQINGGKFGLSADVQADVSGKVKGSGNISYDAASGMMTIKISEVKFSFLNITNKVFEELKKNENEKLRVSKPYVYLKLK